MFVSLACSLIQPAGGALSLTPSPSPLAILFPTTAPATLAATSTPLPTNSPTAFVPPPTAGSPPPTPTVEDTRTSMAKMIVELATILVGTPTITPTPFKGIRCDCYQRYTCEEFFKQSQAQTCFDACGGSIEFNWSFLDEKDRDGIVCEDLP